MACPKKKTSHRKQQQRRAHWVSLLPNITKCTNCGDPCISHYACPSCGYYNGREYISSLARKTQKSTPST